MTICESESTHCWSPLESSAAQQNHVQHCCCCGVEYFHCEQRIKISSSSPQHPINTQIKMSGSDSGSSDTGQVDRSMG